MAASARTSMARLLAAETIAAAANASPSTAPAHASVTCIQILAAQNAAVREDRLLTNIEEGVWLCVQELAICSQIPLPVLLPYAICMRSVQVDAGGL